ncbi:DNA mismatch repair protein MutL [Adhaeribacter arboris]|uniref:DNA mismatch repair protein MutL n=1 Tax=Adhaeribacter arboris TaxID=2072846 RepID=A0A2T2Y9B9_9BACT|nr:DNA mismatch repair endonuclease MutL [Adhaeribacter arboris]PSR52086.1 DNA mismatch repair protein MutL [Adhaeribacter arboris]
MPDIIRLLPEYLANQIAAGEVVQRPASVVKELLENAVDAQSASIQLIVKEAGKQLIQVVDNGLGMSETDARMCFERHATSKIKSTEDLFRIRTMGFRGEALASIAAVAQVELKTKTRTSDIGTKIVIEGSELISQEPVAVPDGTSVCVKNLFYNVPARRNFLKSNPVEMRHILDEFMHLALAHPEIAFSLYQNEIEIFQLPAGKLSQRIVNLFGNNYREQLATCEEVTSFIKVKGYIGKPEFAKKSRGEQFFFVNERYIRSSYLNHAVLTAYEGLLPKDSHPFYVLFIEIAPESIDINVHPTKTEIKFEDEKTVYAIVRAAVKQSLGVHNIAPSLDFEGDVNFSAIRPVAAPANDSSFAKAANFESFIQKNTSPGASVTPAPTPKNGGHPDWQKVFEPLQQVSQDFPREINESKLTEFDFLSGLGKTSASDQSGKKALQVHQKYIMVQVKSGIMLVDQQAAQERILYEQFSASLQKNTGSSQALLFPQVVQLSPSDYDLLQQLTKEFNALGFVFNEFGKHTIVLNGIPADVPARDEKALLEELLEQYKNNQQEITLSNKENLARAMAKRVASRYTSRLTDWEMNALVDKLFACQTPSYTPAGQKTLVMMELGQLQNFFLKN